MLCYNVVIMFIVPKDIFLLLFSVNFLYFTKEGKFVKLLLKTLPLNCWILAIVTLCRILYLKNILRFHPFFCRTFTSHKTLRKQRNYVSRIKNSTFFLPYSCFNLVKVLFEFFCYISISIFTNTLIPKVAKRGKMMVGST